MSKKRYVIGLAGLIIFSLAACNGNTSHSARRKSNTKTTLSRPTQKTETIAVDTSKAVAIFNQNLGDKVTDNDFIVKVYPASEVDHFKLVIHYGGNEANDEIVMLPKEYYKKIELRKGKTSQECVFGFIDTSGKFNEMKLITTSGTSIGIKTLKAYYLTTK